MLPVGRLSIAGTGMLHSYDTLQAEERRLLLQAEESAGKNTSRLINARSRALAHIVRHAGERLLGQPWRIRF